MNIAKKGKTRERKLYLKLSNTLDCTSNKYKLALILFLVLLLLVDAALLNF